MLITEVIGFILAFISVSVFFHWNYDDVSKKEVLFNFVSALPTINQMVIELREIEAGNDSRERWKWNTNWIEILFF